MKVQGTKVRRVKSQAIRRIGYNAESQKLYIVFRSKSIYSYAGVPAELFERMSTPAVSEDSAGNLFTIRRCVGQFYNAQIKGRFVTEQLVWMH